MHSLLTEVLDRARTAVLNRAAQLHAAPTSPATLTKWQAQTHAEHAARAASLPPPRPTEPPPPRVLASYPDAATVQAERPLSKGESRLWTLLHRLAVDVGRERAYTATPRQIARYGHGVTIAGVLGVTDRHLRRLAAGLERAGLLDCGGHAQQVGARSMYDGTLWAVLTLASTEPPRLRAEDWRHNWRPDFEADVIGKTGAAAEMSELLSESVEPEERYRAAKCRAAAQSPLNSPLLPSSDIFAPVNLRGVIDGIAALWRLHSSKGPRAVGVLASQIAAALAEPDRRRYWCGILWQALTAQDEGRTGGLSALTTLQNVA